MIDEIWSRMCLIGKRERELNHKHTHNLKRKLKKKLWNQNREQNLTTRITHVRWGSSVRCGEWGDEVRRTTKEEV